MFRVLRQVAQHAKGITLEQLYEKIAWPLYKKFKLESHSDDEKKVCPQCV